MGRIEEILDELRQTQSRFAGVIILKANVDYSVVPFLREDYHKYILEHHWNAPTIEEALERMMDDEANKQFGEKQ